MSQPPSLNVSSLAAKRKNRPANLTLNPTPVSFAAPEPRSPRIPASPLSPTSQEAQNEYIDKFVKGQIDGDEGAKAAMLKSTKVHPNRPNSAGKTIPELLAELAPENLEKLLNLWKNQGGDLDAKYKNGGESLRVKALTFAQDEITKGILKK